MSTELAFPSTISSAIVTPSLSEPKIVTAITLAELLTVVLLQAVRSWLENTKPSEEPWATIAG